MKLNKKLLDSEVKKIRQLMEDIDIVHSKDVMGGPWDANYLIRKKQGLTTYEKNGYELIQLFTLH